MQLDASSVPSRLLRRWGRLDRGWQASLLGALVVVAAAAL
jgi:hypothetical protein